MTHATGGCDFFLSNFYLKQAYYHVVSHHQQIYYQKNTIILAYNNGINLKPHQWNEVHTSQFMISHYLPLRTLCLIFLYHIDNYKTSRVILQMSQDFVEDCQTLHHANNSYEDIHWYFLIILYSSFFFGLYSAPLFYEQTITQTQSDVSSYYLFHFYYWKWKPLKSHHIPGAEFAVLIFQHKQNCIKKSQYHCFVIVHQDCSLKIYVNTICEIAYYISILLCISIQYCSISLNTSKVFILVLPVHICQIFCRFWVPFFFSCLCNLLL